MNKQEQLETRLWNLVVTERDNFKDPESATKSYNNILQSILSWDYHSDKNKITKESVSVLALEIQADTWKSVRDIIWDTLLEISKDSGVQLEWFNY